MTQRLIFVLALLWVTGCDSNDSNEESNYPDQFGEIAFDPVMDSSDFELCNAKDLVHSRVSLNYTEGRKRIEDLCKVRVNQASNQFSYNGYILVRFLVNCKGQSERFRIETMDEGFNKQDCPEGLVELVESAVRSLNEWVVGMPKNVGKDHSKYLNFKMINGRIDAIIH